MTQKCRPCTLILAELCKQKPQVCELYEAYRDSKLSDEQIVQRLKKLVSEEEVTGIRCSLYQRGVLTKEEAGDVSTCPVPSIEGK